MTTVANSTLRKLKNFSTTINWIVLTAKIDHHAVKHVSIVNVKQQRVLYAVINVVTAVVGKTLTSIITSIITVARITHWMKTSH